jgi:DsbC/DsbD-like thiol-disulfide interchange protein
MKKIILICGLLAYSFSPLAAIAASSEWVASGQTRMRLVVAEPDTSDKTVRAALQVELAPGWKTYWEDPGEAGVPLQLDIAGSQNLTLKAIKYPVPQRFDDGVTVWAGYKDPVSFALEFERGDVSAPTMLTADIFIGICEKICVPFQSKLSVDFTNATASNADQLAVAAAFDALPLPSDETNGVRAMKLSGDTLEIETMLKAGDDVPELFLAGQNGWQFGVPKVMASRGHSVTFEAKVFFQPKENAQPIVDVNYTLVSKNGAVSGNSNFRR